MERILAVIDAKELAQEALFRACYLAQRTKAKVCVLLILPENSADRVESHAREQLEPLIERERLRGIPIEYFIVEGNFKREVVRFIMEHHIDIIVLAQTDEKLKIAIDIQRITGCRTEFVRYKMKPQ